MARSNVRVRPAVTDDVQALAQLVRTVGTRSGVFSGRPLLDSGMARLAGSLDKIISANERDVLVAVEHAHSGSASSAGNSMRYVDVTDTFGGTDGRGCAIIGMLAARLDDIGAVDLTRVLHVTHLMVDPRHRRRGVGRALLSGAIELADRNGVEHVLATTATDSRESNRYLARLGFAPLVVQRIAQTSRLRRTLGMTEPAPDAAVLRRARLIRAQRSRLAAYSAVRGH